MLSNYSHSYSNLVLYIKHFTFLSNKNTNSVISELCSNRFSSTSTDVKKSVIDVALSCCDFYFEAIKLTRNYLKVILRFVYVRRSEIEL